MHEVPAAILLPEKVAIVLAAGLPSGQAANIASCIAAGLSSGSPGWAGRALADAAGLQTAASSHLPITVLSANADAMAALVRHGGLRHAGEAMLGIGFVGAKRWVNRMTGSLPLWR